MEEGIFQHANCTENAADFTSLGNKECHTAIYNPRSIQANFYNNLVKFYLEGTLQKQRTVNTIILVPEIGLSLWQEQIYNLQHL